MPDSPNSPALRAVLAGLPKIDLHRHLEGSLRLASLQDVALRHGLDLPAHDLEALRPYVQFTARDSNYRHFLDKFSVLRRFYQSPETISRLTYEVIADAARDNIRYLELRFTPLALAKTQGYALADVTDWVLAAVAAACRDHPPLRVGVIVSANRHEAVTVAETVAQIAVDRRDRGVVGLDLAGDEVNYSAEPFRGVFRAAREAGLGLVAHAGEWTGAEAVRDAIENLGVQRVGHGVRVVEDIGVAALARERAVVFEVCVTSNLQTGVIRRLADHPLRRMMDLGLRTTLNTDDPAISDISLTDEYGTVIGALGLSLDEIKCALLTAASGALLPPAERAGLAAEFRQALGLDGTPP
jgi:adenosine deaminase